MTSIAKILQAQLDLDEQKKLKEGRQLDKVSDDDGGGFKFDKLEMPTSVAEGFGMGLGVLRWMRFKVSFLQEVRLDGLLNRTKDVKRVHK